LVANNYFEQDLFDVVLVFFVQTTPMSNDSFAQKDRSHLSNLMRKRRERKKTKKKRTPFSTKRETQQKRRRKKKRRSLAPRQVVIGDSARPRLEWWTDASRAG
jgi:hypothetical protein